MRLYTRIIFALNALYQAIIGVLCLGWPTRALGLYQATPAQLGEPMLRASFRLIGINLVLGALMSALIARNPDRHPVLLPLMGVLSVLTLVCWGVAGPLAHEMTVAQYGLDLVVQVLLLIAVLGYARRAGKPCC